jgi:hypothetical protein
MSQITDRQKRVLKFVINTKIRAFVYNKLQFITVWLCVMETKLKTKIDFERQSRYQGLYQYSDSVGDFKKYENEHFIVPWQLDKEKKDKILV